MTLPHRFLLAALLVSASFFGTAFPAKAAVAYIIVDTQTGYVVDQLQPNKKLQVASLTKVATAAVALDWAEKGGGDLAQIATVPEAALIGTGQNPMELQPGDTLTLRDLLYASLVQSDSVAAYTLANHIGSALQSASGMVLPAKSRATPVTFFVQQMNALAKTLGMERTRFLNPHGQDETEKPVPYSTASDLARLTRYAMRKASFRFYVSQKERKISFQRGGEHLLWKLNNTNELLGTNGIDGVKTGTTARAGQCLILSAGRESEITKEGDQTVVTPRHLIVVLLGSQDRFGEGSALLARGWQLYDQWAAAGRPSNPKQML